MRQHFWKIFNDFVAVFLMIAFVLFLTILTDMWMFLIL